MCDGERGEREGNTSALELKDGGNLMEGEVKGLVRLVAIAGMSAEPNDGMGCSVGPIFMGTSSVNGAMEGSLRPAIIAGAPSLINGETDGPVIITGVSSSNAGLNANVRDYSEGTCIYVHGMYVLYMYNQL